MDIKKMLKNPPKEYRPIPFWSWNEKLSTEETARQIQMMDEIGIGGYFMHARGGLETEYMSDEWFANTDVGVNEGEKRGMGAWAYDENGWPSGFAGGKLLTDPDNHAVYLKHEITESFPNEPEKVYAIYALNGRNKPI